MGGWIRLQCCCGAKWSWYGRQSEGAALERLWRQSHHGAGHGVTILQSWGRAA
jgi:hypothetical protein